MSHASKHIHQLGTAGHCGCCCYISACSLAVALDSWLPGQNTSCYHCSFSLHRYHFQNLKPAVCEPQVVVDDHLPVFPGSSAPACAHSTSSGEMWPGLVEKAYAKLHGSYAALADGNSADALEDLTGGVCVRCAACTMQLFIVMTSVATDVSWSSTLLPSIWFTSFPGLVD